MPSREFVGRVAIAAAIASLVLVTVTVVAVLRPDLRDALQLGPKPAYIAHARIDVPASVYESAPFTLVVFARNTCAVCRSAAPFLARAVTEAARSGVAVRLLSGAAAQEDELVYARLLGLDDSALLPVDFKTIRVRRVPTVVLVDRTGEIHYAREGAMPAADQADFLRRLASLTR